MLVTRTRWVTGPRHPGPAWWRDLGGTSEVAVLALPRGWPRHASSAEVCEVRLDLPPGPDSCVCCVRQLDKIEGVFERPSDEVIRELSRALRQALGVSLFGIDIIINNQTGQHAVIDINAFPGEWKGLVSVAGDGAVSVPRGLWGLGVIAARHEPQPHLLLGLQGQACTPSQGARVVGPHKHAFSPSSPGPVGQVFASATGLCRLRELEERWREKTRRLHVGH